jgi:hypothetical protein
MPVLRVRGSGLACEVFMIVPWPQPVWGHFLSAALLCSVSNATLRLNDCKVGWPAALQDCACGRASLAHQSADIYAVKKFQEALQRRILPGG